MRGTLTVVAQAPDTDTVPGGTATDDGSSGLVILVTGLIGAALGARRFRRSATGG
jgi:hypothetical protein